MISVDIVLPYYNGSQFIKDQIDSILNSNLEGISLKFIIVNDNSRPEETNYLKSIIPINHYYIENEKNLGVIRSIELGLKATTANYVMLCDQDDIWLPRKIIHSLKEIYRIESGEPALIFTDLTITDQFLNQIHPSMLSYYRYDHEKTYPSILFHNIATGCTFIMNRKLIEFALPFPQDLPMHDHWLAACAVFTSGKLHLLNENTILYRQHGRNQIGAPQESPFSRLLNWNKTLAQFKKQLDLKSKMADALAQRLNERKYFSHYHFVKSAKDSLVRLDLGFLIGRGIIRGKLTRVLGAIFFINILKKSKFLGHEN